MNKSPLSLQGLLSNLQDIFCRYFNILEAYRFRDKSGQHKYMEIDIDVSEMLTPNPFPCVIVKVWPNGKGVEIDELHGPVLNAAFYDDLKERGELPKGAIRNNPIPLERKKDE